MQDIKDGGPAFPFGVRQENIDTYGDNKPYVTEANEPGMTLRDYFAAKAMQGLIIDPDRVDQSREECARLSYAMADAMIKAREVK